MIGGDGINDESNKTAPAPTRNTDLTKNRERLARPKSTLRHSKISIHAPRMGSDDLADLILDTISRISIHAPRMGSDGGGKHHRSWTNISIHAPRMGSDCAISPLICPSRRFQSTLPGWGATVRLRGDVRRVQDFNPRSPDGERPWVPLMRLLSFLISIHAPRMGSDLFLVSGFHSREAFQSTLPGWGATVRLALWDLACRVFQSTLPGWGATTFLPRLILRLTLFQSTLPGWGATQTPRPRLRYTIRFQSTLPGWGATDRRDHGGHHG